MTEKVLKTLTINFESVTGIHIPAININSFVVKGIAKEMYMHPGAGYKECHERLVSQFFRVTLFNSANYTSKFYPEDMNCGRKEIFSRIQKFQDICSITFEYEGGFSEEIWMNWRGTDETNELQKTYWEDGLFVIEIGEK